MIAPSFGAVYTEHLLYPLWEKKSTVMAPWFRIENAINKSNKGKSLVTLIFLSQSEVKKP